jgi:hypothetical protein
MKDDQYGGYNNYSNYNKRQGGGGGYKKGYQYSNNMSFGFKDD